ncbi:MAG: DUF1854 domain-containing protein [Clostridiales bacterium]|jgi:hypothetical protein|nr:DUF1854 domain-containing protein [Clostridiales bacterium]
MDETKITDSGFLGLEFLNPADCCFYINSHGFIGMRLNETDYTRVKLTRAYPYTEPFAYIGVSDTDDKEIGMLKNAEELSAEQFSLVRRELESRYFCPVITEITSFKEKMGHFYFEVKIGEHKMNFAVKDISRNVRTLPDGVILIFDMDGNRYSIPNLEDFDSKTRRKIEPFLY